MTILIRSIAGRSNKFAYRVEFVAAFLSDLAIAQPRIDLRALFDRADYQSNVVCA